MGVYELLVFFALHGSSPSIKAPFSLWLNHSKRHMQIKHWMRCQFNYKNIEIFYQTSCLIRFYRSRLLLRSTNIAIYENKKIDELASISLSFQICIFVNQGGLSIFCLFWTWSEQGDRNLYLSFLQLLWVIDKLRWKLLDFLRSSSKLWRHSRMPKKEACSAPSSAERSRLLARGSSDSSSWNWKVVNNFLI